MNRITLFTDDEMLRGSASSRNCLSDADEEQAALALASASASSPKQGPDFNLKAGLPVFVSAGDALTNEFLAALGVGNVVRSSSFDDAKKVRSLAQAVLNGKPSSVVVLAVIRDADRVNEDFSTKSRLRHIATSLVNGVSPLEPGNLVTGLAAAILERAMLSDIACQVYLVPRGVSLDEDTALPLLDLLSVTAFKDLLQPGARISIASLAWLRKAVDADETEKKRKEPEGFFM